MLSAKQFISLAFGFLMALRCLGQDTKPLQLVLPTNPGWNEVSEGSTLQFNLQAAGGKNDSLYFSLAQGRLEGMQFDSTGRFAWKPGFDIADRLQRTKSVPLLLEVRNRAGESVTQTVELKVQHVNRPPVVNELRPFYVRYRTQNTYKFDKEQVLDEDGDPLVFIAIPDQMPEGVRLSSQGEWTWTLSQNQFTKLRERPQYIEFWVEDQPSKSRTKGRLKLEPTLMDLPPDIQVVPGEARYRLRENASLNLKFYLSDPNGDDDISTFAFLSDNQDIPKGALIRNTPNQYEFIWKPGYEFVKDPYDTLQTTLTFFVLDKAQNRDERKITITVQNAVNEEAKDRYLYSQYRQVLTTAWSLIEQMAEKEEDLKYSYRRAKKGKQKRSVANASLGAITGVTPAVTGASTSPNAQKTGRIVSSVGGTAVLTMGTLEATEVIGKSMKDLLDRYNYVLGKKSEIQNKGDVFAREFALKSSRRTNDFVKRLDDFRASMNLSGLVALELDAGWQNKKEANDKAIKRVFKDFAPLEGEGQ
jgi:hypothetical protein